MKDEIIRTVIVVKMRIRLLLRSKLPKCEVRIYPSEDLPISLCSQPSIMSIPRTQFHDSNKETYKFKETWIEDPNSNEIVLPPRSSHTINQSINQSIHANSQTKKSKNKGKKKKYKQEERKYRNSGFSSPLLRIHCNQHVHACATHYQQYSSIHSQKQCIPLGISSPPSKRKTIKRHQPTEPFIVPIRCISIQANIQKERSPKTSKNNPTHPHCLPLYSPHDKILTIYSQDNHDFRSLPPIISARENLALGSVLEGHDRRVKTSHSLYSH